MKSVLFIVLLLLPFAGRADEARFRGVFYSANDKYELNLSDDEWRLREKATGRELYRIKEKLLGSMTVLVGDDGQSVVAIDDYSMQDEQQNPEVLIFYQGGRKIKAYKLGELLDDRKFISVSVSHFRWLFRGEKEFSIDGPALTLTTFELNNYAFDVKTGAVLKKERDAILSGDAVYVFGRVEGFGGEKHEIEVLCVISGDAAGKDRIYFESGERRWEGRGFYEALVIKKGKLAAVKGVNFNVCH